MHSSGPINLRPFLNKDWFENGGAGEPCLSVGFFYTLPFIPLGMTARGDLATLRLDNGAPPFSALLSSERFFLRSNIVKMQAKAWLTHPLLSVIGNTRTPSRIERTKNILERWHNALNANPNAKDLEVSSNNRSSLTTDPTFTHGGSSMGNVGLIVLSRVLVGR